jgi:hypothetical protein
VNEPKHTPGPWSFAHRAVDSGMARTQVFCANGETIASFAWYPMPTTPDGVTGSYRDGNARLCAAAPDLLAALQNLVGDWSEGEGMALGERVKQALAAIARASPEPTAEYFIASQDREIAAQPAAPAVGGVLKPICYPDADLSSGLSYDGMLVCGSHDAIKRVRDWLHTTTEVVPCLRNELMNAREQIAALSAQAPAPEVAPVRAVEQQPVAWWRWSYIDEQGNADADVQIGEKMPTANLLPDNGFPWQPLYGTPLAPAQATQGGAELPDSVEHYGLIDERVGAAAVEPDKMDERKAFEAWAESERSGNVNHHPSNSDVYASSTVQGWWLAWKGRAAFATMAAEPVAAQPADEAIRRLFVEHGHLYAGWLELGRAILALKDTGSQP